MRLAVIVLLVARVAAADPVHLRLGTQAIDGSRYMTDITALGDAITKRTNGAVVLDWVSNGQLGDDTAMAKQIAAGTLDGGGLSETGLVVLAPAVAAFGTPGLLRSYADVDRATAALDDTVRDLFARRDLVFLMWADLGFAELFSTTSLDSSSPWLDKPLSPKLTAAIADGRATTWAAPPLFVLASGTHRARAMTQIHYRYVIGGLVISRAAWSRLSEAEQRIVVETCRAYQPKLRTSWRKETERGIAALVKSGIAIATLPDADVAALVARNAHRSDLAEAIVAALH